MTDPGDTTRRDVLGAALVGAATLLGGRSGQAAEAKPRQTICTFTKPFQSLGYDRLAEAIAELGFDGIEAPIRRGGHIEPDRVPDELPRMVEALKRRGLEITLMTSSINRVDPLAEKTLGVAAKLGIKQYRMAYHRYDLAKPIRKQVDDLRPVFRDLAALNRQLGIQAVYQNHASARLVGAPIWDLDILLDGIPPAEIGVAFDIRHATVEGGTAWPLNFALLRPHLGIVYIKDFRWSGRKVGNVPLGTGQVDLARFLGLLRKSGYAGPLSLHEEYLDHRDPKLVPQHLAALKKDLAVLRGQLKT